MKKTIEFMHSTIEELQAGEDVKKTNLNSIRECNEFIENEYHGKNKKVVFIVMINEDADYFVTNNYMQITFYLTAISKFKLIEKLVVFEEPTFEEAFLYCKDQCEVHELGLRNEDWENRKHLHTELK